MTTMAITATKEQELYLAGERVAPGKYRQVGVHGREIVLDKEDILPASLDGRVACYSRVSNLWGQIVTPRTSSRSASR